MAKDKNKKQDLNFDMGAAREFLAMLDPEVQNFTFACYHPSKTKEFAPRVYHGSFEEYEDILKGLNEANYGIYVTINETEGPSRKLSDITNIRAVWQEDDDGFEGKLPIGTSIIVESSPGKYHRYILVKKVAVDQIGGQKEFDKIQKTLVARYGSDNLARDMARVLRVPGFFNTKGYKAGRLELVKLVAKGSSGRRYSWKKIVKKIGYTNGDARHSQEVSHKKKAKHSGSAVWRNDEEDDTEGFNQEEAIRNIIESKEYYSPMVSWAMNMANAGVKEEGAKEVIRSSLVAAKVLFDVGVGSGEGNEHDGLTPRMWEERMAQIDQIVESAYKKVENEENEKLRSRDKLITGKDLMNMETKPPEFLLEPWLYYNGSSMIHAATGVGKSHVGIGIAIAVASGTSFLGWDATGREKRKVVYFDGELTMHDLKTILSDEFKANGKATYDDIDNIRFHTPDENKLEKGLSIKLDTEFGRKEAEMFIGDCEPSLIVIDNISTLMPGVDAEERAWKEKGVADWVIKLRSAGHHVMLIHHEGAAEGKQRGYTNKLDTLNVVIELRRPKDYRAEDGASFSIIYKKTRGLAGKKVQDFNARLTGEGNDMKWLVSELVTSNMDELTRLINDNPEMTQAEMALILGLSQSRISKMIKDREVENMGGAFDKRKTPSQAWRRKGGEGKGKIVEKACGKVVTEKVIEGKAKACGKGKGKGKK